MKQSKEFNYQQSQQELDAILLALQSDGLDVDEALKLYKRGQELIGQLEAYLKSAENTVKEIKSSSSDQAK